MRKFIVQLLFLGGILLVVASGVDSYFTSVFQRGKSNKNQWLNTINDSSYDVGVLGNSRAWWNIDMNTFNSELDKRCINLSNNHFPYCEMLLRLKQFYANGNSVDVLLIQTEYWSLFGEEKGFSNTVYNNIPFLDDTTTYAYLSERSSEWIKLKHVPLWRYSEYNRQWGVEELLITLLDKRNTIFDTTGTFFSNNRFYGNDRITFDQPESFQINADFLAVHNFCVSKGIQMSIFTAPIYKLEFHEGSQHQMENVLDSLGLDYRNYMNMYADSTFFNDNTHLSVRGGEHFTDTLVHYAGALEAKR